jgi:excisionase family DNA binding protein
MSQCSIGLSDLEHGTGVHRDAYLETSDAARYLKYSESHFRALVRAGKLPQPVRPGGPGGKLLWRKSLLDEHMRSLEAAADVIPAA